MTVFGSRKAQATRVGTSNCDMLSMYPSSNCEVWLVEVIAVSEDTSHARVFCCSHVDVPVHYVSSMWSVQ